jgi:hypothetical protein
LVSSIPFRESGIKSSHLDIARNSATLFVGVNEKKIKYAGINTRAWHRCKTLSQAKKNILFLFKRKVMIVQISRKKFTLAENPL